MKTIGIAAILGTALAAAGIGMGAGTAAANTNCGIAYGWSVTAVGPTSCAFAYNVAGQVPWSAAGSGSVHAYSPATGLNYFMECDRWNNSTIECSGGNNASVILQGG
jgi:hypothetical protein